MTLLDFVRHYHEETKHDFQRYARSSGYLDWKTQPDPFRRYAGAPLHPLPRLADPQTPPYDALFTPDAAASRPLNMDALSKFIELALGLSAWKEFKGIRWALRMNPSSGNLHPTEGYIIAGGVHELHETPAIYHYAPKEHGLERRCELPTALWDELTAGFPNGTFIVGLTSIHWREAWKYGERAFRYCQHDAGHALAAVTLSAAVRGWRVHPLDAMGDAEIAALLGLDRDGDFAGAEREHPDMLVAVNPWPTRSAAAVPRAIHVRAIESVSRCAWRGQANALSPRHEDWLIIDQVAAACTKAMETPLRTIASSAAVTEWTTPDAPPPAAGLATAAAAIIRQRRSAVAMDGATGIRADQFYHMLDRCLPRDRCPPWDALGPPACVHLGLFVHLVADVAPGLYCLVRNPDELDTIRAAMRPAFLWAKPPDCPETLPLYLLQEGDCRATAWRVSCDQQIAGAGAFALGMIAEFEPRLTEFGAWFYRRLFWETGVIGQVLYLEAEAAGVRGTGIGCFYDDPVHAVFGLRDHTFQSLYHFTIGGAVEDSRLTTLPPYGGSLRTPSPQDGSTIFGSGVASEFIPGTAPPQE